MSEDEIILTHILQCTLSEFLVKKPKLTEAQQKEFDACKARREQGEPLQYIIGSWDFYGLEFKVDARVLVPRPETEGLVALAIKYFNGRDVLDLGTGSGNIAVTLAHIQPYSQVASVDVSMDALAMAMENAQRHGVESRVEFIHADMEEYLSTCTRHFDMVISNPPYVPSGQMASLPTDVKQEPALALDGGADGLDFYRIIINHSPRLLRKGACLIMEFGDGQAGAIKALAEAGMPNSKIEIFKDLAGKERVIAIWKSS